jgi:CDP-glucose 4,6-dehydratase
MGLRIDAARARKHLGWEPRWDLDAALDATADWYDGLRRNADMRAVTLAQVRSFASGAP